VIDFGFIISTRTLKKKETEKEEQGWITQHKEENEEGCVRDTVDPAAAGLGHRDRLRELSSAREP